MNKIIQQLIKEMINNLDIDESKNFLSVKKAPGIGRFRNPSSDARVGALKGEFLETDYQDDEVVLSIDQEYDRYASLFEQISNDPKVFNIGTNVSVNLNDLEFSTSNNKISLKKSVIQKELSGNALLKVYGSFDKNKTASPSIENIQNTIQQSDMFLTGSSLAPPEEISAVSDYESIINQVNREFGQNGNANFNNSLFSNAFKAITGDQQVPDNPHNRLTSVLNAARISRNLSAHISNLISKTFIDTDNNIFFNTIKDMKGFNQTSNPYFPDSAKYNINTFTNINELNYIFGEVRQAILNTIKADDLAKKYPDFFRSLRSKEALKTGVMSPINLLQQSKKSKPSISDAMLPFAHAAKDKSKDNSKVMIQHGFSDRLIDLNVEQFTKMLEDFEPEIVIIPGSSSKFNSDYFNKIKDLLAQKSIEIKSYSTYKSTHIVSFDEQEAKRDQISQLTRGTYADSFWGATPQGKLSHFIRSIDDGGLKSVNSSYTKVAGTKKAIKVNTDTIFQQLISKSSFRSVKDFLTKYVIQKDANGNIEDSSKNITLKNVEGLTIDVTQKGNNITFNISIKDFDKFIDITTTFFTSSQELETARQTLISEKQVATTYFEQNGITQTSGNLIAQISGNAGSGSSSYSSSVRALREERIKRMLKLKIGDEYEIDKNKKTSKTLSEMGAVKISEIGSLQQGNQSKRVFLKDMHEIIDDANLPNALRPLVLDYLNTFASLVYDQMIQNVFDKADIVNNLTKEMKDKIINDGYNTNVQTPIFDIMLGIGTVDAFEALNPSFKDIKSKFEKVWENLSPADQESLGDLRRFIIDDFFKSIADLKTAVAISNRTFEEFVEIYKSQIFNLITAKGSDFSSNIINDISDLNKALLGQIEESGTISLEGETEAAEGFREAVKKEYEEIYKIAEEKALAAGLNQYSDFEEIVTALLNEENDDSVNSFVFDTIASAMGESENADMIKDALESMMLGDPNELKELIEVYANENEDPVMYKVLKDAESAALSFLDDVEFKKIEMYSAQDSRHTLIMDGMKNNNFITKCVAVIMNSFVLQTFKQYLNSPSFNTDLANLIKNNAGVKEAINKSLAENCLYIQEVKSQAGVKNSDSIKLQIVPKIDLSNQKLIFSAFSSTHTNDKFSFKINFDLVDFLNTDKNIERLNTLMEEISQEFAGVGLNRPKKILLLDDNVSSGGTFGLIAKNILKIQTDNRCYFLFDDVDSPLTSYQGDLDNFSFDEVKSSTNKCLTHIIGLTPIFI